MAEYYLKFRHPEWDGYVVADSLDEAADKFYNFIPDSLREHFPRTVEEIKRFITNYNYDTNPLS